MTNYDAIRRGLAANLDTLPGIPAYAKIQATLDAPASVVGPFTRTELLPRLGKGRPGDVRTATWTIPVRLYIGDATELAAQDDLDVLADWNDAGGVVAAIESDPTLGGIAESCRVLSIGRYGSFDVGTATYLGVEVTVEVVA